MSIGFGRSYQCVGLNRRGAYRSVSPDKGPQVAESAAAATEKPNEIWRRITGIFPGVEQKPKERKRGLKLLTKRIQERVRRATRHPGPLTFSERDENGAAPGAHLSLTADWDLGADDWVRVRESGISVEALCVELGCTRSRLTLLLREYCGMCAGDFVDGLKFSRLKSKLSLRLREAALELWGFPGSYVAVKLLTDGLTRGDTESGKSHGRKVSRYFCTRPEELFEESRADERTRRIGELCAMLRLDFDLESWALSAGFDSGAKLKRACLNVLGRTLSQLERMLAAEVVQFYFCAEDRELREIALRSEGSVTVARAREIYHGSDEKPEPPFVDEYAKFEELKAEWLSRMWDQFG